MKEPIKSGDMAEVVGGLGRGKSPNLGKIVTVVRYMGDHSQHGRMWHCTGQGIQQMTDGGGYVTTDGADFAQSWLRKIETPKLTTCTTTDTEITA